LAVAGKPKKIFPFATLIFITIKDTSFIIAAG